MKGFGIHVKNDLLEPKHIENMGMSIWLYMWFLDKMTSISEEGVGKVLGGKPIKYEEIKKELGISRKTYVRWVEVLEKAKYINVIRAPYGLIITVNKAVKTFNKRCAKSDASDNERDVPKVTHLLDKNDASLDKNDASNKTIQLDNTVDTRDTDVATDVADVSSVGKKLNNLLYKFKTINPNYERFFSNNTERRDLQAMIDKYTYEKMDNLLNQLPELVQKPYAPRITSPSQLFRKMGELIIFIKQEKRKEENDKYRGIDARGVG